MTEIGSAAFLHAFFSTVAVRLEASRWGSRFPALLLQLYQGELPIDAVNQAQQELAIIEAELASFPPSDVVWDFEHRDRLPPWGSNIAASITSLANYFWTSDGHLLIDRIRHALTHASAQQSAVRIA